MFASDTADTVLPATPVRIIIIDDHPAVREGLTAILDAETGLKVIGVASSGEAGVSLAVEFEPDVVLMDLQMPVLDGVTATARIVAHNPRIFVLVLTMFEDRETIFAALKAGARGYLLKDASRQEIARAVRGVAAGEAVFGAGVASRIIDHFKDQSAETSEATDDLNCLTVREREVLDLIAAGHSNAEITRRLVLSPKTVRNHISNVFSKLQVTDRSQAIVRAREAGLGRKKQT